MVTAKSGEGNAGRSEDEKQSKLAKREVDGFIMRHKTKGMEVKCTQRFRKQWEKRGFEVVYEGKIDVSDWDY